MTCIPAKKILSLLWLACFAPVVMAEAEVQHVITAGYIGELEQEEEEQLSARTDAVVKLLAEHGIEKSQVISLASVGEMVSALKDGRVDWLTAPLFHALIYAENAHAVIFAQKLKAGISKFQTVFFIRKNSDISDIGNMERKMIGFGDPLSTSDFFIPYYELHEHNYTLVKYGEKVDGEVLGKKRMFYRLSGSQRDVVKDVLGGQVDIGVLSNHQYEKILPELKKDLKVIYTTAAFPVSVEVVRAEIEPTLKLKLRDAIGEQNANDDTAVLQAEANNTKFYDFVGEGRDGYVYMRSIVKHGIVPVDMGEEEKPENK